MIILVCYDGPDKGKGISVLTNSDNQSVLVICKALQLYLLECKWDGVDIKQLKHQMETMGEVDFKNCPQEEIVNQAYKNFVFNSFK